MSIPAWKRSKTLSNRAHDEIIDEVNRQGEPLATGDIHRQYDGTIFDGREDLFFFRAIAVIVIGEDSNHTYTDPRYRCKIQKVSYGTDFDALVQLSDSDDITEQFEGATAPVGGSPPAPIGWTVTATNISEITSPNTGAGTHTLREDGTLLVEIFAKRVFVDSSGVEVIRWFFTSGGSGSGLEVLRIVSVATRGWYTANITKPPIPKAWIPIIVLGVDTATTYIDGSGFINGDYAQNLADHIVYHRVAGAWVNAAGHKTDSDFDTTISLDTVAATVIKTPSSPTTVIILNMWEILLTNMEAVYQPLIVGSTYLAKAWYTNSNGDKIYIVDGAFKLRDGTAAYQVLQWNGTAHVLDWVRAH